MLAQSYSICPFGTGLFHSAECPPGSSLLQPVSEFPFIFLRLNNIPVYSSRPLGDSEALQVGGDDGCVWHPTPDRTYGKSHGLRVPTCPSAASHPVGPFSLLSTPAPLGFPRESRAPLSGHREGLGAERCPWVSPEPFQKPNMCGFSVNRATVFFGGGGNVVRYSTEMIKRGAKGSHKGKYLLWSGDSFSFLNVEIEDIFLKKNLHTPL